MLIDEKAQNGSSGWGAMRGCHEGVPLRFLVGVEMLHKCVRQVLQKRLRQWLVQDKKCKLLEQ